MFFGVLFIAIGLAVLLNTLGLINGTFWGLFWAIFFLAIGFKMVIGKGKCPMCAGFGWQGKMHEKIHEKMNGHCCDGDHDHEEK
ncbi:MAG: DUF5668 domain-containing protein [bacterium]|nr:DUF5668 domain-containing protein [bacterium]